MIFKCGNGLILFISVDGILKVLALVWIYIGDGLWITVLKGLVMFRVQPSGFGILHRWYINVGRGYRRIVARYFVLAWLRISNTYSLTGVNTLWRTDFIALEAVLGQGAKQMNKVAEGRNQWELDDIWNVAGLLRFVFSNVIFGGLHFLVSHITFSAGAVWFFIGELKMADVRKSCWSVLEQALDIEQVARRSKTIWPHYIVESPLGLKSDDAKILCDKASLT
ncbi:hypothetical protein LguiB_026294 [Lonicera macranthoides]